MIKKSILTLLSFLLLGPALVHAQIQPTNANQYNVEVRFWQAYGVISEDSQTNPPDPSWQVRVANDTDGLPNDLLRNSPNVINHFKYFYSISTFSTGWHAIQNASLGIFINNTTGYFDFEVMSYENDCTSLSIYNLNSASQPCGDNDDFMRYKEGTIHFEAISKPALWHQSEIGLTNNSSVRFRHLWRYSFGSRAEPLIFGAIEPAMAYGHCNVVTNDGQALPVSYINEWNSGDPNFTDYPDVTYSFYLPDSRDVEFSFVPSSSNGQMHLLRDDGSYIRNLMGTDTMHVHLTSDTYLLVFEGNNGSEIGEFNFSFIASCNNQNIQLGSTINSGELYETGGSIQSAQMITSNFSQYDAGTEITLNPNFEVEANASFHALIEGCGVTDENGNNYRTVFIGDQEWMAENIRVEKYSDGSPIPNLTEKQAWLDDTQGAWCRYNNGTTEDVTYGNLYNWYAIDPNSNGGRNVCPTGWRVPDEDDWNELGAYLHEGNAPFMTSSNEQSKVSGGKMKSLQRWAFQEATNESGWSGLPGGGRIFFNIVEEFWDRGDRGTWWSSNDITPEIGNTRVLFYYNESLNQVGKSKNHGYSVRCIRD